MVHYYFPPRGGVAVQRIVKLCKYLDRFGCDVAVVTSGAAYAVFQDEHLASEIPPSVTVFTTCPETARCPAIEGQFRKALLLDPFLPWIGPAIRTASRVIRAFMPHVLFTTSPPHSQQVTGLYLKWKTRLPWVVDFRDPWTADQRFRRRKGPVGRLVDRTVEGLTLRSADVVLATAPQTTERFRKKGVRWKSRASYECLTNGYDPEDYKLDWHREDARFTIAYVGSLGLAGTPSDPTWFLEGLSRLLDRRPRLRGSLVVRLIGTAPRGLAGDVERLGLTDVVEVVGHVPHREAVRQMLTSDCLLLLQVPVDGRPLPMIPAKLFEYIGAGRPILASVTEGDTADIVRRCALGTVVDPLSPSAIAAAIERLYGRFQEGMPPKGYDPPEVYNRIDQARRLAGMLHGLGRGA